MQLITKTQGDKHSVSVFESKLGFKLPDDYKSFLIENDGVKIVDGAIYIPALEQKVLVDVLCGVKAEGRFNIQKLNDEFGDDLAENSLIIGQDVGGSFVLLSADEQNIGIYLYDHSYFFEQSSDENNTYFICNTFSEF